jgi:hypothetical protein
MIKEIEVSAMPNILDKIHASGLPCKMDEDGVIMTVTIDDDDSSNDLLKLATALAQARKVTVRCVKMDGHSTEDIVKAAQYMSEKIIVGGLETTRGELIKDMQAQGQPQIYIDRYLQGLDLGRKIRGEDK